MNKETNPSHSSKDHSAKKQSDRDRIKQSHKSHEEIAPMEDEIGENLDFLSELSCSSEYSSFQKSLRKHDEEVAWEASTTSSKPVEDVKNLLKELSEGAVTALKNGKNEKALDYLKRSEEMLEVR